MGARSLFFTLGLALGLTGCATAPVQETRAFVEAVSEIRTASDALLDDVAVANRAIERRRFLRQPGNTYALDVRSARAFATIGEPELTSETRRALLIVYAYADLLLSLVDGRSAEAARARAAELVVAIGEIVNSPTFGLVGGRLTFIAARIQAVRELETARSIAVEAAPLVRTLLEGLRDAGPELFSQVRDAGGAGPQPELTARERVRFANYIVQLEQLIVLHEQLVAAYRSPGSSPELSAITRAAVQLAADVRAARRAYAAARGEAQ